MTTEASQNSKTYSIFGDSISTFKGMVPEENRWYYDSDDTNGTGVASPDETWWMQVINHEGARLLANASFSGSMVDGAGFPAGRSKERALQILGLDGAQPDAVLVFIGINDYGWGSPEAQLAGGSEAAPKQGTLEHVDSEHVVSENADSAHAAREHVVPDLDTFDPAGPAPLNAIERFESAYSEMLANIREAAPEVEIWCLTLLPARVAGHEECEFVYDLRGIALDDYNDAIRRAAKKEGARVADIRALGYDYESIDGTHPTREGMCQFAALASAAMASERGNEAESREITASYPETMRSKAADEAKTKAHPGQCNPNADIRPDRWSCVYSSTTR